MKELEYIDSDYLVYCSHCDSPQIDITLNNKWGNKMTRKDYIKIAKIIKDNTMQDTQPILNKDSLINDLCVVLKQDNNLFDKYRFIDACE